MAEKKNFASHILIIGIGNEYRSDDAAGIMIARRLREKNIHGIEVIEHSGDSASLIETWQNADVVFVIDAVSSGGEAGTIHRFEAHTHPLPITFFNFSTHAFSIAETIEMARTLDQLPRKLVVYGVEGENFETGVGLSKEVEDAIEKITRRVGSDIEQIIDKHSS